MSSERGSQEYYLSDGLGSTTGITDGSGAVADTYQYDVFGANRSRTGTSTSEFKFTGEQTDPSGLQYLRARYYDSATGRFIGKDPLPLRQRYAYVGNNPANLVDPSGLLGCGIFGRVCQFVSGTAGCAIGPVGCALSLFSESWADKQLVGIAGASAAALANSPVRNKEGGIRLIENCSSAFCRAVFATSGATVDGLRGVTVGDTILAPGPCRDECFRHESTHVAQFRRLGLVGFNLKYFGAETANNAFGCITSGINFAGCLYDHNALETEAYDAQNP